MLRSFGFFDHFETPVARDMLNGASDGIKAPRKTDSYLGCIAIVETVGWTNGINLCIQAALSSNTFWPAIIFQGRLGGKLKGFGRPSQTRVVVPQPTIAKACN
eukprot:2542165-Pyramimonas_sp.AAC.1